jgi:hydroxypyruvate isomerase
MPTFAANLSLLFTELPLPHRFAAARKAGFEHVEMLFPYEMSIPDLKLALDDNGLDLVLINTPAGDWDAGERGFMGVPRRIADFRNGFLQALEYAGELGATYIHLMSGIADPDRADKMLRRNLAWAAYRAENQALTLEPINTVDIPGYLMNSYDQALDLMDWVGAPNVHLQFDAYHAHRITGDVLTAWQRYGARTRHIQIAGYPGRHEPIGGDIDFKSFFSALVRDGYAGVVSAEYFPVARTDDGLGWLKAYA